MSKGEERKVKFELYHFAIIALILGAIVGWFVYPSINKKEVPETRTQESEPLIYQPRLEDLERKTRKTAQGTQIAVVASVVSLVFSYLSWNQSLHRKVRK